MASATYIVTGTLTDQSTVALDEALPITATKVRVTIETLGDAPARSVHEILVEIHKEQEAHGLQPPTAQEVDEYLRQERDSWE